MATKCPKCGGELVQTTPEIAKCKECGAAFKRKGVVKQSEGTAGNQKTPTKKCKHCKSDMPTGAKVCPVCRNKQKGGCLKWVIITFAVLMLIGIGAGALLSDAPKKVDTKNNGGKAEETKNQNKDTFSMGETAEMNDVQVTMTNYQESAGSEFNMPTEGNVFLLVEFEIANNSDEELGVSSMLSFEAYADDYAANLSLNALMENQGNQLDGSVAPGKKMKGWVGYEVPANWSSMEMHFTENVWVGGKFKFLITK